MSVQDTAFRDTYNLAFQVSPIILTGGIASQIPGGAMPVISLMGQVLGFGMSAIHQGVQLSDFYAYFLPMEGATTINNSIGHYPFANQHVAGNAYVEEPKNVSLMMVVPVKDHAGYLSKLAQFTSFRNSLNSHVQSGGTFDIATPSFLYQNCVLKTMTDASGNDSKQQQIRWQLDFEQPLVTQSEAKSAVAGLMDVYQSGKQVLGNPSWTNGARATANAVNGAASNVSGLISAANGALGNL